MKKPKTNKQTFTAFIKNANDMELAFARAWLGERAEQFAKGRVSYGPLFHEEFVQEVAQSIADQMGCWSAE